MSRTIFWTVQHQDLGIETTAQPDGSRGLESYVERVTIQPYDEGLKALAIPLHYRVNIDKVLVDFSGDPMRTRFENMLERVSKEALREMLIRSKW